MRYNRYNALVVTSTTNARKIFQVLYKCIIMENPVI